MSRLTCADRRMSEHFIRAAVDQGVLSGVTTRKHSPNDAPRLGLACPDYTQLHDRMTHYWNRVGGNVQMVQMHGGMLLLDPESPEKAQLPAVVYQIHKAIMAKRVHGVEFAGFDGYVDWPCGVGHGHGMTAPQLFASAIRAGDFFMNEVASLPVRQLFYLGDLKSLACHRVVAEHPEATGFTFAYTAEDMTLFLETYCEPVN